MGAVIEYIGEIETKVDRLIDHCEQLESDKLSIQNEKNDLEAFVKKQSAQIQELENQLKLIKIAKQIDSGEDNKEVKKKISEFIKEIDNCIALLNS